jgi:hypothetical protein
MTVSSACLTLLTLLLVRRPYLRRAGAERPEDDLPNGLLTTGTFGVALVLGVAVPGIGYLALLLLFLTEPVRRLLARRAR